MNFNDESHLVDGQNSNIENTFELISLILMNRKLLIVVFQQAKNLMSIALTSLQMGTKL